MKRLDMIELLNEAAEVEHMLALQYLFAAASLKTNVKEFSNEKYKYEQADMVRNWKALIQKVAREEMQHLHVVNEVIVAIGGEPHFDRPNFPVNYYYTKKGTDKGTTPMVLMRFDGEGETIKRFITFEQRPGFNFPGPAPEPVFYDHLSELYNDIINGLKEAPDLFDLGREDLRSLFPSNPDGDVNPQLKGNREIKYIKDLKSAIRALEIVIEQGEGGPLKVDENQHSHLKTFQNIWDELEAARKKDDKFEPARNVISNPQWRVHRESTQGVFADDATADDKKKAKEDLLNWRCTHQVTDDTSRELLEIFSASYEILVMWLRQIFGKNTENEHQRLALRKLAFFPYMTEIIQSLSELITEIQIPGTDFRLGPSYELTSAGLSFPHADKLHVILKERLRSIIEFTDEFIEKRKELGVLSESFLGRLVYIRDTFRYIKKEIHYRFDPLAQPVGDFSESGVGFDPAVQMGTYLKLEFEGWAQLRLPSDPDPSFDKRGCDGNSFAYADEPDLDRILRFQKTEYIRPNLEKIEIGVNVTESSVFPADFPSESFQNLFKGAKINLDKNPSFQGRNDIVGDGTEAMIDPFHLQVLSADDKVLLERTVTGPSLLEMTTAQRRGSGRSGTFLPNKLNQNLRDIGRSEFINRPKDYWNERIDALTKNPSPLNKARLGYIKNNINDLSSTMNRRLGFSVRHQHTISGADGWSSELPIRDDKWFILYDMGLYDTDALSFFVKGYLCVPLSKKRLA